VTLKPLTAGFGSGGLLVPFGCFIKSPSRVSDRSGPLREDPSPWFCQKSTLPAGMRDFGAPSSPPDYIFFSWLTRGDKAGTYRFRTPSFTREHSPQDTNSPSPFFASLFFLRPPRPDVGMRLGEDTEKVCTHLETIPLTPRPPIRTP